MLLKEKFYFWQGAVFPDLKSPFLYQIHLVKSRFVNCKGMCSDNISPAGEGKRRSNISVTHILQQKAGESSKTNNTQA